MMKVLALFLSLSVKLLPTLADQLPLEEKTNFLPSAINAESGRRSLQNIGSFEKIGLDINIEMVQTNLGTAVAMSEDGSYIAVGAPKFDFPNKFNKTKQANNSGMVRVLKYTGSEWVQVGSDLSRFPANFPQDEFGQAVAISADGASVAVGIPHAAGGNGCVDVYKFNGTDWDQLGAAILGTGNVTKAQFGKSVALSHDGVKVVIGAPEAPIGDSARGFASVYTFNATAWEWIQVGDHVATGREGGDQCGYSVDISGDGNTVAVGAPHMSKDYESEGITTVHQWNGTQWEQKGFDIPGEGDADESGTSISLSQDATRIAISAPYNYNLGDSGTSPTSDFGNLRVFEFGSDWEQLGNTINGFQAKSLFGQSVSLSNDGCRVAVGESHADVGGNYHTGRLHVYDLFNETTWHPFAAPIGGLNAQDEFGHSVSLSGDGMRVGGGAIKYDFNGVLNNDDGQARVFALSETASCGGDPHFRSFSGVSFSFHGQCDMVLMKSQGIEVHIRTTRIDRTQMSYSYISAAAVAYGNDVVEAMADGTLIVNGKETIATGEESLEDIHVAKSFSGLRKNIIVYDLTFGEKKVIQIRVNTKVGMIFVDAVGHFSQTTGLLGSSGGSFARDGVTDMAGLWNSFGEEWQVQAHEPKLFKNGRRAPQYPAGCSYEQVSNTKLRRRLTDASAEVDIDTARKVCSKLRGDMKDYCITDVMITGDVELVDDPFYN